MYKERKDEVMKNTGRKIKLMILMFFVFIFASLSTIEVYAIGSYTINGVTVKYTDFSSSPDECWVYANNIYKKIWGTNFTYAFSSNDNMLRNLSDGELTLTVNHLKSYVSNASLGSCLRICNSEYLHGSDGWGHSQIIVQKDANGFAVLEGGLSASPYCREKYYTWSEYCNTGWLGGTYQYIKYIKWPGAPAYSQLTEKPMNVVLALEKTTFFSNEHVTYYCAGDNVDYYVISIYDDRGNVIETVKVLPGEYCTRYYEPGNYMAYCEGYNSCGNTFSNTLKFIVKSSTETIPHIHDYISTIKKPATCIKPGIMLFTCKDNDDSYEEEIPPTGHQHTELRNVKAATCAQEGYTGDTYCKDCNTKLATGKSIAKKDHTWDAGKITTAATCSGNGIKTYTCIFCGITKTEAIAATGHGATEIRNKKDASVTSEGYTGDIYCTICNQKISLGKTIAKLTPQTATPGKTIKDKSTNGVYKVLKDGVSVEFTKPVYKKVSVRIPDTIKVNGITCKVTGISANAFKNNKSLNSVTIGRNVTVIGTNAFYGCKKLSKVNGGNGIVKIDHRAFANCSSLSKIIIPGSVRSIGKQAFCNCKKLRSITIKTSTLSGKSVGLKAFAGTYKKPTVKVPAKQMKAYKKILKARGMSSKAVYRK